MGKMELLFGYFKMPLANLIDMGSPLGMSLFGNAMEELKDLIDKGYGIKINC